MALSHRLLSVFIALGMALSSARFAVGMALCSREFHAINVVILLYHTMLESTGYSTEYGIDFGDMNIYDFFSGEQRHAFSRAEDVISLLKRISICGSLVISIF